MPAPTGPARPLTARIEVVEIHSFDDLYQLEYGPLVGLAYSLTGRLDVAEELVQDAMVQAYRDWGRVSSYDKPGAWVRRVLLNLVASRGRRRSFVAKARLALDRVPTSPGPSPDSVATWAAVRRLPRRQAEVIAMYYLSDLSVDQIAETLDCAPGTVRTHLVRGRRALAEILGDDE